MQDQFQLNILKVYRHNNKNYLTGISLLLIGCPEYILTENKNILYEIPQFIIDDLYYNMPNLEVRYYALKEEQIETIYPLSYENQEEYRNKGYTQEETESMLKSDKQTIKQIVKMKILQKQETSNVKRTRR